MENQTQEVIIVIAVVVLLAGGIWLAVRNGGDSEVSCDNYQNYATKDLPARCIKYFQ